MCLGPSKHLFNPFIHLICKWMNWILQQLVLTGSSLIYFRRKHASLAFSIWCVWHYVKAAQFNQLVSKQARFSRIVQSLGEANIVGPTQLKPSPKCQVQKRRSHDTQSKVKFVVIYSFSGDQKFIQKFVQVKYIYTLG